MAWVMDMSNQQSAEQAKAIQAKAAELGKYLGIAIQAVRNYPAAKEAFKMTAEAGNTQRSQNTLKS